MSDESLSRFVCPDDPDAASAYVRYLERTREHGSRGQGTYYAHTGSRVTLERFDRVPTRLERIA